jgi:anthranilate synthase/aminodeoxychorismate synthase-like glutamine amidotransferase
MRILVIDNYDSFTYNLVQLLGVEENEIIVKRNDEINIDGVKNLNPKKILISPGPGRPEDSGISLSIIKELGSSVPILGVCLGMQAICYSFGVEIINSKDIYHGKTSLIKHNDKGIFKDIPQNFEAMRYHSLVVKKSSIPDELEITAKTKKGVVMGLRHRSFPLEGILFHPESILTSAGKQIINNWLTK